MTSTDNIEWFVNMVNIGTYKIPEIQKQYAKLQDEVQVNDHQTVVSKAELENMTTKSQSCVELCISYLQLAITKEMSCRI
jgi:hypothetical protein